ncbi:MAG TPA: MYXO-CTERM sorting domain-containing protein [Casimicrobiaceae bacterium]|nr:MYXO-CTERM sorting domain-containing protein [Casimicrobiaceae bacterium]
MVEKSIRKALAAVTITAALMVSAGTANAIVYSSSFDPPDFSGVATFDVAPACLLLGPGTVSNGSGGCTVTWLTAMVTLNQPTFTSRTFTFEPFFLPSVAAVNSIFVSGGELAGVDTSIIGPRVLFGDINPLFNGPFWLEYDFSSDGGGGELGLGVVNLYGGICPGEGPGSCAIFGPPSVANVLNFTRVTGTGTGVPEPVSAALALAALGAAWLARRRSRSS